MVIENGRTKSCQNNEKYRNSVERKQFDPRYENRIFQFLLRSNNSPLNPKTFVKRLEFISGQKQFHTQRNMLSSQIIM